MPLFQDRRVSLLQDAQLGKQYISDNLHSKGALFLFTLPHSEGELAVGLGRRTFDAEVDNADKDLYEIEWFERKKKKDTHWGKRPGFKLTVAGYRRENRKNVPYPQTSVEPRSAFLPIVVKTNKNAAGEPSLTEDCLSALRAHLKGEVAKDADGIVDDVVQGGGVSASDADDDDALAIQFSRNAKRKRKASVVHDDDC